MSAARKLHYDAFDKAIRTMEKFNIEYAVEIGEKTGLFDNYNEEKAIERDKKQIIRGRIANIKDKKGYRLISITVVHSTIYDSETK